MSVSIDSAVGKQAFDQVAAEYDFAASLNSNHDFILAHLSDQRQQALDIGCGSGLLTLELARQYDSVVGVDISLAMLKIAQRKRAAPNISYMLMNAEQLALKTQFDFIVSVNTLHHVKRLAPFFSRLKSLLKANGTIVLVDVISQRETPPVWMYIFGALQDLLPDVSQYDAQTAFRLFRFRTSKAWLQHLATDRYLSASSFRQVYGNSFAGCEFAQFGSGGMAMIWNGV